MTESTGCGAPTEEKYKNFVFHIKHFKFRLTALEDCTSHPYLNSASRLPELFI